MKIKILGLAFLLLFLLVIPLLSLPVKAQYGGRLLIADVEPRGLSSIATWGTCSIVESNIFESLYYYQEASGNWVPCLAESFNISSDMLTYTFKLRRDVYWHDGVKFTAKDVVWTIEYMASPEFINPFLMDHLESVSAPDDYTVIVKWDTYDPNKFWMFSHVAIYPEHLYNGTYVPTNPYNNAPIGTGPFKFVEWVRGSHILLRANENYRLGRPYLDEIMIVFYSDPAAAVAALENGEIDHIFSTLNPDLNEIKRLSETEGISVRESPRQYFVTFLEMNHRREPFNNVLVRKAICAAIDREEIVHVIYLDYASVLDGPIPPGWSDWINPDAKQIVYNPSEAESLLDQAGYTRGEGGIRFETTITVTPDLSDLAVIVKDYLSKVGIKTTIRVLDSYAYTNQVWMTADFDLSFSGVNSVHDPIMFLSGFWFANGSQYYKLWTWPDGTSHIGYNNPEVTELVDEAYMELNMTKKKEIAFELQEILCEDQPVVWLASPKTFRLFRDTVQGTEDYPDLRKVWIGLLGDLNYDGIVDIRDIYIVARAFGKREGDPGWDPTIDIDKNGVVNIVDVATVARQYGKKL